MASSIGVVYVFQKKLERLLLSIPGGYPESKYPSINGYHDLTNKDRKALLAMNQQKFVCEEIDGDRIWKHKKYCENILPKPVKITDPAKKRKKKVAPKKEVPQLDALVEQFFTREDVVEDAPPAQSDAAPMPSVPVSICEAMPEPAAPVRKKTYVNDGTLHLGRAPKVITSPMAAALIKAGADLQTKLAAPVPVKQEPKQKEYEVIIAARDRTICKLRKENDDLRAQLSEALKAMENFMRDKRAEMIELANITKLLR